MAWLLLIAGQLLTTGRFLDVAVRDVLMALGAFTLARLAEERAEAEEGAPEGSRSLGGRHATA